MDGAPYLVLEYVAGEPVDRYCNTQALTLEKRLNIFRQVCSAVHVAHQKLVLHRDIKTANVLIDAHGMPKLLDFGIAKLLTLEETQSDLTQLGFVRPLTLEWSSPEQLRGEPLSTTSDVYSLGVLLFVLLTGRRPHASKSRTPIEFAGAIESAGPLVLQSEAGAQTPPGIAERQLKGDILRIVRKALAPDGRDRYATVDAFDADIERLLAGKPVHAHAHSVLYRFGKLVMRQRIASAAILIATLGLIAATVISLRQAEIADQERQRAQRRFADVKRIANVVLFDLNDTLATIPGTLNARTLLVENALRYLDDMARDSGRESDLLAELAAAYERVAEVQGLPGWPNAGRSGDALSSLQRALDLRRRVSAQTGAPLSALLAEAKVLMNIGLVRAARGDSAASLQAERQSEATLVRVPLAARDQAWLRMHATVLVAAGDAVWELGDIAGAARDYTVALARLHEGQAKFPGSIRLLRQTGVVEQRLGDAAAAMNQWPEARRHLAASLAVDEALLKGEPTSQDLQRDLGTDWSRVGVVAFILGEHREALNAHERALALRTRLAVADPNDARSLIDKAESELYLAQSLMALGRTRESRAVVSTASASVSRLVERDPDNARLSSTLVSVWVLSARIDAVTGHRASALDHITEARRLRKKISRDHPDFRLAPERLAELDALEAAVRTGSALPVITTGMDPWRN
jgi:non-specific serine/threonine protein kinase/serine/threonine-protein kinase